MIRDVHKSMLSKLSKTSLLQALQTLLTIDEVVRFDNKIHGVRLKCDHEESGAEIRDCWLQQAGAEGVTWRNPVASKCTNFHHGHRPMDGCASNQVQKGHSRSIHEVACPALCTRQSDSFQPRDSTNAWLSAHSSLDILQYASQHKAKPQRRRVAHSRLETKERS